MNREFKKPPFTLDRSRHGGLVEQLADSLRKAIETGYYGPGEMLPPTRDLSELLGVSRVVAIRAMRRLSEQRLIIQRPRSGSVVCPKGQPQWKGQVLLVTEPGIGNADDAPMCIILRDSLIKAGYLPLTATAPRTKDGKPDFTFLSTFMRQQIDLTVLFDGNRGVAQWLSRQGKPFVWLTDSSMRPKNSLGTIRIRNDLAMDEFTEHCRQAGVKRAMQVKVWDNGLDIAPALNRAGVKTTTLKVPPSKDKWKGFGLANWAMEEFSRRSNSLPELVFFQDDHLTTGALLAFAIAGKKIPQDVRIVSWANRNYGPVSPVPLTRMEMDCEANGRTVAEGVLQCLRSGRLPEGITIGPRYIRGNSF